MAVLTRFRIWLASKIAPKPKHRIRARGPIMELMGQRLREIEGETGWPNNLVLRDPRKYRPDARFRD